MSPEELDVAVDDYQHYLPAIRQTSAELGVEFVVAESFPFRVGHRIVDTVRGVPLGFVLAAPGKEVLVLSGVQTDVDFACVARDYFGRATRACPDG
jgi:hypothetical protein